MLIHVLFFLPQIVTGIVLIVAIAVVVVIGLVVAIVVPAMIYMKRYRYVVLYSPV